MNTHLFEYHLLCLVSDINALSSPEMLEKTRELLRSAPAKSRASLILNVLGYPMDTGKRYASHYYRIMYTEFLSQLLKPLDGIPSVEQLRNMLVHPENIALAPKEDQRQFEEIAKDLHQALRSDRESQQFAIRAYELFASLCQPESERSGADQRA